MFIAIIVICVQTQLILIVFLDNSLQPNKHAETH